MQSEGKGGEEDSKGSNSNRIHFVPLSYKMSITKSWEDENFSYITSTHFIPAVKLDMNDELQNNTFNFYKISDTI